MKVDRWLDEFLRERRVAVLAIPRGERSPVTTPVWYDWDGARFRVQVEAASVKAKQFASGPRAVSLTVQSELPPYRYAVVHGTATLGDNREAGLRRKLARRYFGRLGGDQYVADEEQRGVTDDTLRVIEIAPERVVSHDFHEQAGRFGRLYFTLYRWLRPLRA